LAKYGQDGFASDDEEMLGLMNNSNEQVSQGSISSGAASSLISPLEAGHDNSSLTSPASNLDRELEKLLLEEAKKQGLQSFDAVSLQIFSLDRTNSPTLFSIHPKAVNYFKIS
jgi:hypothetical protein